MYQPMQSILPLGSKAILLDKDVCPIVKDLKKIKNTAMIFVNKRFTQYVIQDNL